MRKYSFFLFAFAFETSLACSPIFPDVNLENADFVFFGEVSDVDRPWISWYPNRTEVTIYFEVLKSWKGNWNNRPVKHIEWKHGMCGSAVYREGERYIVSARYKNDSIEFDARMYVHGSEKYIDHFFSNQ